MSEKIDLGQGIVCTIRKSRRARQLRLALYRDGRALLILPSFVSYQRGLVFLESKKDWIREKTKDLASRPENILRRGSKKEYQDSREPARQLIEERLKYFQQFYAVIWKRVSIRNQKTRWGSCSQRGSLSFNYRLLLLSPHLRDYIIVHELCHLLELNHSQRFWALVAKSFPDYLKLRRELKLL
ncbi:MAG: M48 family metallopeptidase [bacterium]|nr:M48 family metallopeptidase [bacterium]